MSIAEALLADFRAEAESTRKVLKAVPDGRMDWKPHEKSMALGQLAGHIAETPAWAQSMMEDVLDFAKSGGDWKPFRPTTAAELLEAFEKHREGFEKLVADKSDDFLGGSWTMRHGDQVLMQTTKHDAIRSTVIHHVIHHRGQLTVFLRLLDVPVPGTYGPTADEQAMA